MQSGFGAVLIRITAMTVVWLLCAASLTFAGSRVLATDRPDPTDTVPEPTQGTAVRTLTVPDVRGQPYVFAKGILEEGGFAWLVDGDVEGYAANLVVTQLPEPGATVVAEGTPTIMLVLERHPDYEERGSPENESPYDGSEAIVIGGTPTSSSASEPQDGSAAPAEPKKSKKNKAKEPTEKPNTAQNEATESADEPAEAEPESTPPADEAESKRAPEPSSPKEESEKTPSSQAPTEDPDGPDFVVPGAPEEPPGAMPLPERAAMIGEELAPYPSATSEMVDWYLYQHEWVITGAKFGWSQGAEALEVLIAVDLALYERWGIGAKSADYARETLKEVNRIAKEYGN